MSAFNRRGAIKSALVSTAVPVLISGCISSPAAAAICMAAPYVPPLLPGDTSRSPDAKLLDLCARFRHLHETDEADFDRYCSMPADAAEAKTLAAELDGRDVAWAAAGDACYATAPRTPAGAAALLDTILLRDATFIDEEVQKPLRLLRDSLLAMVSA